MMELIEAMAETTCWGIMGVVIMVFGLIFFITLGNAGKWRGK